MIWSLCLCIGLCSGLLAGLLGIGGGTVIVPALMMWSGWLGIGGEDAAPVAMATALAIVIPTSISSASAHAVRGAIDWRAFRRLAPGVAAGALVGTVVACAAGARFALAAFVCFALLAARQLVAPLKATREPDSAAAMRGAWMRAYSVAIGLLSALAGVGGGLLSVPLLARYLPMKRAIGTASALGLPLAVAGLSGYLLAGHPARCAACVGYVFVPGVLGASLAAIAAAPLGANLAHRLPVHLLKRVFAALLVCVSVDLTAELLR